MKRNKSTSKDEIVIVDESAYSPDRLSSMRKLASDGFGKQLHPVLNNWLNHSEFILRDGAISMLLGSWGHQKYVDTAIEMLHQDKDWSVRISAVKALTDFCIDFIDGKKYEEQIIKELLLSLLNDKEEFVQQSSYEALIELIKSESLKDNDSFDKENDADWKILEPYLEKYDLQKPS